MAYIKGTTATGFKYKVDSDFFNDVEFLELFADMQDGNSLAVFKTVGKVLGDEQKKALYEHKRNKKGVVPADKLVEELTDIFKAMSENDETKK